MFLNYFRVLSLMRILVEAWSLPLSYFDVFSDLFPCKLEKDHSNSLQIPLPVAHHHWLLAGFEPRSFRSLQSSATWATNAALREYFFVRWNWIFFLMEVKIIFFGLSRFRWFRFRKMKNGRFRSISRSRDRFVSGHFCFCCCRWMLGYPACPPFRRPRPPQQQQQQQC